MPTTTAPTSKLPILCDGESDIADSNGYVNGVDFIRRTGWPRTIGTRLSRLRWTNPVDGWRFEDDPWYFPCCNRGDCNA